MKIENVLLSVLVFMTNIVINAQTANSGGGGGGGSINPYYPTRIQYPGVSDRPAVGEVVLINIETWTKKEALEERAFTLFLSWRDSRQQNHPLWVGLHTERRRIIEWEVPSDPSVTLVLEVVKSDTMVDKNLVQSTVVDRHAVRLTIVPEPTRIIGDLNNDGRVDNLGDMVTLDLLMAFPHVNNGEQAHWTENQLFKADLNLDGQVDNADEEILADYIAPAPGVQKGSLPLGDVSMDGKITGLDIVLIRKHILGIRLLPNPRMADVNRDGIVDNEDIRLIRRYILNYWQHRNF